MSTHKIGIVGSRYFTDIDKFDRIFERFIFDRFTQYSQSIDNYRWDNIEIVSGGCPTGIDLFAKTMALDEQLPYKEFPADWNTHGKAAGPIRNSELVGYCDEILILWDGRKQNCGTWDVIQKALDKGVTIIVMKI